MLLAAAEKEGISDNDKSREFMARYVGDTQCLDDIRSLFQQKRYSEVVALAGKIQYPDLMTKSQRRIIEFAARTAGSSLSESENARFSQGVWAQSHQRRQNRKNAFS